MFCLGFLQRALRSMSHSLSLSPSSHTQTHTYTQSLPAEMTFRLFSRKNTFTDRKTNSAFIRDQIAKAKIDFIYLHLVHFSTVCFLLSLTFFMLPHGGRHYVLGSPSSIHPILVNTVSQWSLKRFSLSVFAKK